jgi:hypothetical protein
MNQGLIDAVIEQMKLDIQSEDWTAIEELLRHVPEKYLVGYLPCTSWNRRLLKGESE